VLWGREAELGELRRSLDLLPEQGSALVLRGDAGVGKSSLLFQAAAANLNPWTEAKVDSENPERGPLLIVSGEKDHTVPRSISEAAFHQQQRNPGVTEFVEIANRGHSLTIDSGWREVANTSLEFIKRFA
jgi:pimeloyl-ACP methyl ester carboxylesterase